MVDLPGGFGYAAMQLCLPNAKSPEPPQAGRLDTGHTAMELAAPAPEPESWYVLSAVALLSPH